MAFNLEGYRKDLSKEYGVNLSPEFAAQQAHQELAPEEEYDSWVDRQGMKDTIEQYKTQKAAKENKENMSVFERGIRGGIEKTKASFYGAGALAADAVGWEGGRDWALEGYQENMQDAAEYPTDVRFTDIGSAGDFASWAGYTIGDLLPTVAAGLASGGLGAAGMTLARKGAAKGVRKGAGELVEKMIKSGVNKQMAKGVSEDVAKKAVTRGLGAQAGLVAGGGAMEGGHMYGEAAEQLGKEVADPYKAGVLGLGAGLIELAGGNIRILKKILGTQTDDVLSAAANKLQRNAKSRGKTMNAISGLMREAARQAPAEFSQEALQEIAAITNINWTDPEINEWLTDENAMRVIEAGAAGGLMGLAGAPVRETATMLPGRGDPEIDTAISDIEKKLQNQQELKKSKQDLPGLDAKMENNQRTLEELKKLKAKAEGKLPYDQVASDLQNRAPQDSGKKTTIKTVKKLVSSGKLKGDEFGVDKRSVEDFIKARKADQPKQAEPKPDKAKKQQGQQKPTQEQQGKEPTPFEDAAKEQKKTEQPQQEEIEKSELAPIELSNEEIIAEFTKLDEQEQIADTEKEANKITARRNLLQEELDEREQTKQQQEEPAPFDEAAKKPQTTDIATPPEQLENEDLDFLNEMADEYKSEDAKFRVSDDIAQTETEQGEDKVKTFFERSFDNARQERGDTLDTFFQKRSRLLEKELDNVKKQRIKEDYKEGSEAAVREQMLRNSWQKLEDWYGQKKQTEEKAKISPEFPVTPKSEPGLLEQEEAPRQEGEPRQLPTEQDIQAVYKSDTPQAERQQFIDTYQDIDRQIKELEKEEAAQGVKIVKTDQDYDVKGMRGPNKEDMNTVSPDAYGKKDSGWLGNSYVASDAGGKYTRQQATQKFKKDFLNKIENDPAFKQAVLDLKGKKIGYYKPNLPKHLDVVTGWLQENTDQEQQQQTQVQEDVLHDPETNQPVVVYRGYASDNTGDINNIENTLPQEGDRQGNAYSYNGIYFTDSYEAAQEYADLKADMTGRTPRVAKFYLRMRSPHRIKTQSEMYQTTNKNLDTYDGAVLDFDTSRSASKAKEYVIKDMSQAILVEQQTQQTQQSQPAQKRLTPTMQERKRTLEDRRRQIENLIKDRRYTDVIKSKPVTLEATDARKKLYASMSSNPKWFIAEALAKRLKNLGLMISEASGKPQVMPASKAVQNININERTNKLVPYFNKGYFGPTDSGLISGVPKELGGIYFQYADILAGQDQQKVQEGELDPALAATPGRSRMSGTEVSKRKELEIEGQQGAEEVKWGLRAPQIFNEMLKNKDMNDRNIPRNVRKSLALALQNLSRDEIYTGNPSQERQVIDRTYEVGDLNEGRSLDPKIAEKFVALSNKNAEAMDKIREDAHNRAVNAVETLTSEDTQNALERYRKGTYSAEDEMIIGDVMDVLNGALEGYMPSHLLNNKEKIQLKEEPLTVTRNSLESGEYVKSNKNDQHYKVYEYDANLIPGQRSGQQETDSRRGFWAYDAKLDSPPTKLVEAKTKGGNVKTDANGEPVTKRVTDYSKMVKIPLGADLIKIPRLDYYLGRFQEYLSDKNLDEQDVYSGSKKRGNNSFIYRATYRNHIKNELKDKPQAFNIIAEKKEGPEYQDKEGNTVTDEYIRVWDKPYAHTPKEFIIKDSDQKLSDALSMAIKERGGQMGLSKSMIEQRGITEEEGAKEYPTQKEAEDHVFENLDLFIDQNPRFTQEDRVAAQSIFATQSTMDSDDLSGSGEISRGEENLGAQGSIGETEAAAEINENTDYMTRDMPLKTIQVTDSNGQPVKKEVLDTGKIASQLDRMAEDFYQNTVKSFPGRYNPASAEFEGGDQDMVKRLKATAKLFREFSDKLPYFEVSERRTQPDPEIATFLPGSSETGSMSEAEKKFIDKLSTLQKSEQDDIVKLLQSEDAKERARGIKAFKEKGGDAEALKTWSENFKDFAEKSPYFVTNERQVDGETIKEIELRTGEFGRPAGDAMDKIEKKFINKMWFLTDKQQQRIVRLLKSDKPKDKRQAIDDLREMVLTSGLTPKAKKEFIEAKQAGRTEEAYQLVDNHIKEQLDIIGAKSHTVFIDPLIEADSAVLASIIDSNLPLNLKELLKARIQAKYEGLKEDRINNLLERVDAARTVADLEAGVAHRFDYDTQGQPHERAMQDYLGPTDPLLATVLEMVQQNEDFQKHFDFEPIVQNEQMTGIRVGDTTIKFAEYGLRIDEINQEQSGLDADTVMSLAEAESVGILRVNKTALGATYTLSNGENVQIISDDLAESIRTPDTEARKMAQVRMFVPVKTKAQPEADFTGNQAEEGKFRELDLTRPYELNADVDATQAKEAIDIVRNTLEVAQGLDVQVFRNFREAPLRVQRIIQDKTEGKAMGMYHKGTVYIFADKHAMSDGTLNDTEMMRTFLHEAAAHHGLKSLFNNMKEYHEFLWNVNDKFKKEIGSLKGLNTEGKLGKIEEFMARKIERAEFNPQTGKFVNQELNTWMDKIAAFFAKLARGVSKAMGKDFKLTRPEIREITARVYKGLEMEKRAGINLYLPDNWRPARNVGSYKNFKTYEENTADYIIRMAEDAIRPIVTMQKALETSGVKIEDAENVVAHKRLYPGKSRHRATEAFKRHHGQYMETLKNSGLEHQDIIDYMWAEHLPERAEAMLQAFGPDVAEDVSSLQSRAERLRANLKENNKFDKAAEVAKTVYAANEEFLDTMQAYGIITEEHARNMRAKYKNFVPMMPEEISEDMPLTGPVGRLDLVKNLSSRAGTENDPVMSSFTRLANAIVNAEKNDVKKSLFNMARNHTNTSLFSLYYHKSELDSMQKEMGLSEDDFMQWKEDRGIRQYEDLVNPGEDPIEAGLIPVRMDGKDRYIDIMHEGLKRAFLQQDTRSNSRVMRAIGSIARWLTIVNTQLNPEFMMPNMFRDASTSVSNMAMMQNMGSRIDTTQVAKEMGKSIPKSVKGIYNYVFGDGTSEHAQWYKEFIDEGGKVGMPFIGNSAAEITTELHKIAEQNQGSALASAMGKKDKLLEVIYNLNEIFENAARLSTYKTAVENGVSKQQAAVMAREISVDFDRKGEMGQMLNSLYLFANAGIGGTARILRGMAQNPKKALKITGNIAVGGFMLAQLNRMVGGEDEDDGRLWFEKIGEDTREMNMVFMIPGTDGDYIKIPLPYGFGFFYNLGQHMNNYVHGENNAFDTSGKVIGNMLHNFNPISASGEMNTAHGWLQLISPTLGDPIVDIGMEKTPFGTPLMPRKEYKGQPDSHRFWNSATTTSKKISATLNDMMGGSPVESSGPFTDISPETLDYLFNQAGGGAGRFFFRKVPGYINKWARGEDRNWNDVPMMRRFAGEPFDWQNRQFFNEAVYEVESTADQYKELQKMAAQAQTENVRKRMTEHLKEFRVENQDILSIDGMRKKYFDRLKTIETQKERIHKSGKPEAEKRKLLEPLDKRGYDLMKDFNRLYLERMN